MNPAMSNAPVLPSASSKLVSTQREMAASLSAPHTLFSTSPIQSAKYSGVSSGSSVISFSTEPTMSIRTPDEIRAEFAKNGVSIAGWATAHGFNTNLVFEVEVGRQP